ncbi:unnamed protein product [Camellia sinensis]
MNRTSINSINQIIQRSICSAPTSEPVLNTNFLSKSSFSSLSSSISSFQILTHSQTKSISNPLYSFLPHTQNPNNIVDLICSNLKQHNTHFPIVHKDIQGLLPHLGTHEISRVLLRCQSDSSTALTFFNWVKNDLGLKPSTHNYCIIVHILAWSRNYSRAMKLLSELIELNRDVSASGDVFQSLVQCTDECNWNPVTFDMLVKAYVKVGMIKEGLRSFRKMVKLGFVPHVVVFNSLLDGLLKSNYTDQCWRIYEDMGRIGVHPNLYTFNILTNAFCKGGDVDKVNEFLEKMEEEGFDPDIVTYNTLIDSYCKKGRLKDAFYLYKIMYRRGVMPDLVSYTALMNGLCKEGKVREAHQILRWMVHRGLTPDILTYNTLICGYCKEGMMQESRLLLPDMVRNGIFPDNFTCWILVEGYVKEGRLLSALNMVVELQRFGVSVCRDIYDYLILALCQENRPCAAKNLLERMSQVGHQPKEEICNELIYSLSKCDFVEEALLLKAEMVSNDMKPNLVTYKALIGCLCRLSRSVEGESLMREMVEFGVNPDIATCRALINGFCKERNLDNAESLLGSIVEEFQIYDIECCNALLKIYCEAGDVAKLMELQDRLLKVGFAPNSLTFKYMIDGLCKATYEKCDHRVPEVIEKLATYWLQKSCTYVPWSLGNLQQLRSRNTEFRYIYYFVEYIVDAYIVVLRHLVGMGLLVHEAQVFGVELLETVFSSSPAHHKHSVSPKKELIMQGRFPSITRPEDIIFRLLRQLWSQDQPILPSSFLLNFASNDGTDLNNMHN